MQGSQSWKYLADGGRAGWTRRRLDACARHGDAGSAAAAGPPVVVVVIAAIIEAVSSAAALRSPHCIGVARGRGRRAGRAARRWGPLWAPVARAGARYRKSHRPLMNLMQAQRRASLKIRSSYVGDIIAKKNMLDVVVEFGQREVRGRREEYGVAEGDAEGGKCLRRGVAEISSLFVSLFTRVHQNTR